MGSAPLHLFLGRLRRIHWSILALSTVALALTLRLLGLRLGLPYHHHWDEGWIVDNATNMLHTEDAEPRSYMYGAPTPRLMTWVFHVLQSCYPKRVFKTDDDVLLRWIGRSVGVAISSTGAFAVFVTAKYMLPGAAWARTRAMYAALLYATASELVTHGRYANVDASYVALVAWALAFASLYLRDGRLIWGAGTVLSAAVACGFKVTAMPALVIPGLALPLRSVRLGSSQLAVACDRPWVRRGFLVAALPTTICVFFLLNPHMIRHWESAIHDFTTVGNEVIDGKMPAYLLRQPGLEHLKSVGLGLAMYGFHRWHIASVLAAGCGVAGLALAFLRGSRVCAVAALHAIAACVPIALMSKAYLFRYYLVAMPALCVGFGFTMQLAMTFLCRRATAAARSRPKGVNWPALVLAAAFAVLYVAVPLEHAVMNQRLSADARIRAFDWMATRSAGRRASVACTPEIIQDHDGPRPAVREALRRRNLSVLPDVDDAQAAAKSRADYVVVTSIFDPGGEWGDRFRFSEVPGYRLAKRFEANPYEHNWEISSTWSGRFNTIVLERIDHRS